MLSAKQKIQKSEVAIRPLFEAIWKEKQKFFSRSDIDLIWTGDDRIIETDPTLAKIFFANLIENIMKYSLPGKVVVESSEKMIQIQNPAKKL